MADLTEMTKEELLEEAKRLDIEGRSTMNKDDLLSAVQNAQGQQAQDATAAPVEQDTPQVEVVADRPAVEVSNVNPEPAPNPFAPTPSDGQPVYVPVPEGSTVDEVAPPQGDAGLRRMAEQSEATGAQPNIATERTVP